MAGPGDATVPKAASGEADGLPRGAGVSHVGSVGDRDSDGCTSAHSGWILAYGLDVEGAGAEGGRRVQGASGRRRPGTLGGQRHVGCGALGPSFLGCGPGHWREPRPLGRDELLIA